MKRNNIHPANKKRLKTQREKILAWLQKGRTITTMQAITMFGCTRAAARIHELRHMGHVIKGNMVSTKLGTMVMKYKLEQYQAGIAQ